MKKNAQRLFILFVTFFLFCISSASAQTNRSFGFSSLMGFMSGGSSSRSEQPAPAEQPLPANYLTATVNGERITFELERACLESYGPRNIDVSYVARNPRGDIYCEITLNMPNTIAPGRYKSSDRDMAFSVYVTYNGVTCYATASRWNNLSSGSYDARISSRSSDWMTYSGSFNAVAGSPQTTFNFSGSSNKSITIENAEFSFTLEG